jgi:hypothetical protein
MKQIYFPLAMGGESRQSCSPFLKEDGLDPYQTDRISGGLI